MLKSRIVFFLILIALSAVYIGGCRRAGKWLVKEDVPVHADAMVLLMGSFPERVLQAADLYHEGKAGRLMIVEESMGPYQRLEARGVRYNKHYGTGPECCCDAGYTCRQHNRPAGRCTQHTDMKQLLSETTWQDIT